MRDTILLFTIVCLVLAAVADAYAQDSLNVELVGMIDFQGDFARDVIVVGDLAYVMGRDGLLIIDLSDPENPDSVGYCEIFANDIAVSGDYAYVATWDSGLRVISVADPEYPEEVGYCDIYEGSFVTVSGDYAYVTSWEGGLRVISVFDPEAPEEVGYCDMLWETLGVAISGDYAYVAAWVRGFRIISVADPENPEEVGLYDVEEAAFCVFASDDDLVYVTVGILHGYGAYEGTGFHIIDVSDPENPDSVGFCETGGGSIFVSGNLAYSTTSNRGGFPSDGDLYIIDVSDPENPNEIGFYETPGAACNVFVSGDLIYVADFTNLGIYRFINPDEVNNNPVSSVPVEYSLSAPYPNPFNPTTVTIIDLPQTSFLRVSVHNILGEQIDVLADGQFTAGNHSLVFDGTGLPSGIYFIHAEVKEKMNEVRKV
ncbi:T9SS type A sorting domain-containing protein, partial [Calditrichota bacterium]